MRLVTRNRRDRDRHRTRPRPEPLEGRALMSAAGTLDSTFGDGAGYATATLGLRYYSPTVQAITYPAPEDQGFAPYLAVKSVVAEADGEIVTAGVFAPSGGTTSFSLAIALDNADGTPDTSFGVGGVAQVPVPTTTSIGGTGSLVTTLNNVTTAVQADGKIIVATSLLDAGGNATFLAVRLNLDGSVDTNYGAGGFAEYPASTTTPVADRLGNVEAAVIQGDGKLVLLGNAVPVGAEASTQTPYAAVRLNTDGSIDTNYGTAGTVDVPVTVNGYTDDQVVGAALQADGQIVMAGSVLTKDTVSFLGGGRSETLDYQPSVIRLSATGTLDTTYGGSTAAGIVLLPLAPTSVSTVARGVAIDPTDGQVLVSAADGTGGFQGGERLYRLNTDGTPDTGFGTGGVVMPAISGPVAVQADGKILVASVASGDLARLNADGTFDSSFGDAATPGLLRLRPTVPSAAALAIQPTDGNILVAANGNAPSPAGRVIGLSVFRVLSSANANPSALPPPITQPADLDGSGQTNAAIFDPAVNSTYQPNNGSFLVQTVADRTNPTAPLTVEAFGLAGVGQTIPAVADYLGLGYDQLADYQPATGTYEVRGSSFTTMQFGTPGVGQSIPVPADYDNTGKADMAVYLVASGTFAIVPYFVSNPVGREVQFGTPGPGQSIPAPADYYGTGQADIAVYLAAAGAFAVQDPTGQTAGEIVPFGMPGLGNSIPVPGDYDGSGHTEFAVFVPSTATFYYRPYNGGPDVAIPFGTPGSGELPVVGDYDGSGRTEVAVYDPSRGFIAYRPALGGNDVLFSLGGANSGSVPVATPAGALPEYAASGSGGGSAIALNSGSSGASASSAVVRASSVPQGPQFSLPRVARTLVNQGNPEDSKLTF